MFHVLLDGKMEKQFKLYKIKYGLINYIFQD